MPADIRQERDEEQSPDFRIALDHHIRVSAEKTDYASN